MIELRGSIKGLAKSAGYNESVKVDWTDFDSLSIKVIRVNCIYSFNCLTFSQIPLVRMLNSFVLTENLILILANIAILADQAFLLHTFYS